MARTKKPRITLTSAQKKEQRRLRREARKSSSPMSKSSPRPVAEKGPHEEAQFWLQIKDRAAASKILNEARERPYRVSIPGLGSSPPVISPFYPCSMYRRKSGRWYYCFLFREHRDQFFLDNPHAKKEYTE